MPTPPASSLSELRSGTATLTREATADVNRLPWEADSITEALHDVLPDLISTYTEAAGAFAADWYDAWAGYQAQDFHALGRRRFTAIPADLGDAGAHALVGWAAQVATSPETFHTLILGGLQRRIANGTRQTIMKSAIADPNARGWKRIASGKTCDFCQMLASRGAVYTEKTVDFHTHDHCDCVAVPEFRKLPAGTPVPEPPTPAGPPASALPDVRALSLDELDAEMSRLMSGNDFGERYDKVLQRMDEMDAERMAEEGIDLPEDSPDYMHAAYQDRLTELIEDWETSRANKTRKTTKQLREEYDAWAHTQWLAAENATRGQLFNRTYRELSAAKKPDASQFFDGSLRPDQIRKYASNELLEWFAANPRLSFDEWRSMNGTNKSARLAQERVKYRTLSEYG